METSNLSTRPQVVLALLGLIMLTLSWLGLAASQTTEASLPMPVQGSRLQVMPSGGAAPRSVIDQLQGAGGLQGQQTQGLQQPIGEQLQPNAKTDNLNSTRTVQ
ncbi:MAG TPA: hypothetical protein VGA08_03150 [Candidatus Saccharimonadales bacterium]